MAKYSDAIRWIASYDDTEWVTESPEIPSVSACLVADIFNKTEKQVREDIEKELNKQKK